MGHCQYNSMFGKVFFPPEYRHHKAQAEYHLKHLNVTMCTAEKMPFYLTANITHLTLKRNIKSWRKLSLAE